MAEPAWEHDDHEGPVVHMLSATIDPNLDGDFTRLLSESLHDLAAAMPGFLEGRVFEADDRRRVIVMTHWETRHAWAQAQWNDAIGRVVAQLHESADKIEMVMGYQRAVVYPPS
jgi:heme-degrading monooxygenase HmoA